MSKTSKSELRTYFKNIRNNINDIDRANKSNLIRSNFLSEFSEGKVYFIYKSYLSEADTEGIIKELFKMNKTVLIPKCDIKTETMTAVKISEKNSFRLNQYGILESDTGDFFEKKIDIVVLPGLGFDKKGNRIGYGKGYYDKFLNSLNYKPLTVGLCYSQQIIESIDICNNDDVKLDYIVTDQEIIKTICE